MKIMTLKINSAYPIHETAVELLSIRDIQLKIIKHSSPFVLAQAGSPDIVIHPLSKVMTDEFPMIKFCGPDCSFPNYNWVPEIGYSEIGCRLTVPVSLVDKIVLINTTNNMSFTKYLESLSGLNQVFELQIYGNKCNSLYYYGPLNKNSYDHYKEAAIIGVDNEAEALKALFTDRVNKLQQHIVSSFDYNGCINFKDKHSIRKIDVEDSFLEYKNWNNIFNRLFNEIGVTNG